MSTRKITLLSLLFISMNCFSQEKENIVTDVTKLTFLNPGIGYEKAIGKFQTIAAQAFMNFSASYSYSSSFGTNTDINIDPALIVQYRYYYNYSKRQEAGRRTDMNSLNYISPTVQTVFSKSSISSDYYPEAKRRSINTVGVVWGFQRNYQKRFSLDLNLGLGYTFTTGTIQPFPGEYVKKHINQLAGMGQLNLGFWLNKRK